MRHKDVFKYMEKYSDKETPFLLIDISEIEGKYKSLKKGIPFAEIFYAVKANPDIEVLKSIEKMGSSFDIASRYELDRVLSLGVSPERISYGNTIKKGKDIEYFFNSGVRLFATDSKEDMLKISQFAPGSNVFFRVFIDNSGADWPLSNKFGACPSEVIDLINLSKKKGLIPYGLSFHVGSQQKDINQWDYALCICKNIFDECEKYGIKLKMINLGGGLPSVYKNKNHPDANSYFKYIKKYIKRNFGNEIPRVLIEPGRFLVGESGILVSSVILRTKKSNEDWLYIDAGKFNGLIETLDECIKYKIITSKKGSKSNMIIAGPTCDSCDILYKENKYSLPSSLREGDKIYFLSTGAYTSSYCSVEFNGFPPLKTYIIN